MKTPRQYIAIDLKSFYASVECVERGLDPLDVCLVVADQSRTSKTICLAMSPALKKFGLKGRPRLFEVEQKVREVNRHRGRARKSVSGRELELHHEVALDYITATPRMALYIDYSSRIYGVYLRYIAPEDIHVYSIDEVFIDATSYLGTYRMTAHELTIKIIRDVLAETGITATAGIGTNMYLCKVAMDIVAKKMPPDNDGVRIAQLDEMSYRRSLWDHMPLTDFWRIGRGIANRLAMLGILTMGDLARFSINHEEILYKIFGINAELLIDHAWGQEPVTMDLVKAYRPESKSVSNGQVLICGYAKDKALTVALEMADNLSLNLVDKRLLTDQLTLYVSYDASSLSGEATGYDGQTSIDRYGRSVPQHAHGTANLPCHTSSESVISATVAKLFDRIVHPGLLVRRLTLTLNHIINESERENRPFQSEQLELFRDYEAAAIEQKIKQQQLSRERRRQEAVLSIKKRFGKNAILRGLNYADGATQRDRNTQIGGHKA